MSNNVNAYIDYFRQLAVKHKDLQHVPASETGDADPGSKRFIRWSADEVVTGLKSKVAFPALLIELYDTETNAENVYDIRQNPKGAFTVLQHAHENFQSEQDAYATAESIVYDLLQKIWQDHYASEVNRCAAPFEEFYFNKINITPISPIFDNEVGYRVEFEFKFQNSIDIASAPAEGTFI